MDEPLLRNRHPSAAGGRRRGPWRFVLLPAAAILVVALVVPARRGAPWSVVAVEGGGIVVVDHAPVPLNHLAGESWRLASGARVRVPEGARIELASGAALHLQIEGGTDVALPRPPGRWLGRSVSARLVSGRLRIVAGEEHRGARLRVTTPDAEVAVAGARAAVISEPAGTCVCVLAGEARVKAGAGDAVPVTAGRRRFASRGGGPPEEADIRPDERERLASLGGPR